MKLFYTLLLLFAVNICDASVDSLIQSNDVKTTAVELQSVIKVKAQLVSSSLDYPVIWFTVTNTTDTTDTTNLNILNISPPVFLCVFSCHTYPFYVNECDNHYKELINLTIHYFYF